MKSHILMVAWFDVIYFFPGIRKNWNASKQKMGKNNSSRFAKNTIQAFSCWQEDGHGGVQKGEKEKFLRSNQAKTWIENLFNSNKYLHWKENISIELLFAQRKKAYIANVKSSLSTKFEATKHKHVRIR